MSIYSGSSPFSGGKLGGNKIAGARSIGAKLSRGKGKRISKSLERRRNSNRETRSATVNAKGFAPGQILGGSSSRMIRLLQRQTTSNQFGLIGYDGLSLTSATGGHAYVTAFCGTDYANATEAFSGLQNIDITLQHVDALTSVRTTHIGFLGPLGTGTSRLYYIEFPTKTTAFATNDIVTVKLEFTT